MCHGLIFYQKLAGKASTFSCFSTILRHFQGILSLFHPICSLQPSGVLLHQLSGNHNHVAAAHTFQPKIHADPQYLPLAAPARMRFFHLDYITDLKFHTLPPFLKSLRKRQPDHGLPFTKSCITFSSLSLLSALLWLWLLWSSFR